MKLLCYYAFIFLCPLFFLPHVLSLQCSKIQYEWPIDKPSLCCNMCPPGDYLVRRPPDKCGPECQRCTEGRYTDTHNVHLYCELCHSCNKPNMEYESQCNGTHNAVCRCKAGYRCNDQPCKECVPIPPTTTSTPPPSTTALKAPTFTTLQAPFKPGYFLAGQPTPTPTCSEDEDVSTPVQEVCGKCDQPIDV
ncbi:hypothetical protein L3Q82_013338 [Scortum barcoo]|uniref:Uncharacterized protein n=1 Tax=Scortum barcoo TaxID=214431 RepID=A0ACB8VZW9_9TELE|nr:hypothetical protein L3Q82_013338 [Scortum barcoo]